jgi:hypothetical protein
MMPEDIYNLAKKYFINFNILNYYSCIFRSVSVLCSGQLVNVVGEVCDEIGTTLASFIKLQCEMWYKKKVPTEEIKKIKKTIKGLQLYVLQDLIIGYCDMHDIKFSEKQKLASILEIELKRLT